MLLKTLNVVLFVTAVIGAYFGVRAGRELRQLRAEHHQLVAEVGSLDVRPENNDKLHVAAIKTGSPLEFAWQIYVPAGFNLRWSHKMGSGSSGSSGSSTSQAYFDLVRVRLREKPDGAWDIWTKHRSGASLFGVSHHDARWLSGSDQLVRDKLVVEQLGTTSAAILDRNQGAVLLRLSHADNPQDPPLLEILVGERTAAANTKPATAP